MNGSNFEEIAIIFQFILTVRLLQIADNWILYVLDMHLWLIVADNVRPISSSSRACPCHALQFSIHCMQELCSIPKPNIVASFIVFYINFPIKFQNGIYLFLEWSIIIRIYIYTIIFYTAICPHNTKIRIYKYRKSIALRDCFFAFCFFYEIRNLGRKS